MTHAENPRSARQMIRGAPYALTIYLENLQLILSDFESLKAVKLIMPEEPDEDDEEAYEAWELAANAAEDNPRYRPVMDASEAQEAA